MSWLRGEVGASAKTLVLQVLELGDQVFVQLVQSLLDGFPALARALELHL